ncbi:helix-turn-helix domain-containing protein [Chitinophaga sp. Hz27]|uniref:helix-turn-helix domain-containing protein n=1 Tax=Chitinophaga sp. Hz27 TaxID=3347169 RepID=UPI0035E0463C
MKGHATYQIAFGKKVKELREAAGLSTREFADHCDIALAQVWRIESGRGNPTLATLFVMAQTLKVSVAHLTSDI